MLLHTIQVKNFVAIVGNQEINVDVWEKVRMIDSLLANGLPKIVTDVSNVLYTIIAAFILIAAIASVKIGKILSKPKLKLTILPNLQETTENASKTRQKYAIVELENLNPSNPVVNSVVMIDEMLVYNQGNQQWEQLGNNRIPLTFVPGYLNEASKTFSEIVQADLCFIEDGFSGVIISFQNRPNYIKDYMRKNPIKHLALKVSVRAENIYGFSKYIGIRWSGNFSDAPSIEIFKKLEDCKKWANKRCS